VCGFDKDILCRVPNHLDETGLGTELDKRVDLGLHSIFTSLNIVGDKRCDEIDGRRRESDLGLDREERGVRVGEEEEEGRSEDFGERWHY
jgi:hypothetical protein